MLTPDSFAARFAEVTSASASVTNEALNNITKSYGRPLTVDRAGESLLKDLSHEGDSLYELWVNLSRASRCMRHGRMRCGSRSECDSSPSRGSGVPYQRRCITSGSKTPRKSPYANDDQMEAVVMTLKLNPFRQQPGLILFLWIPQGVVQWTRPMTMDSYLSDAMGAGGEGKRVGSGSFELTVARCREGCDYYARSVWNTNSYTGEERTIRWFLLSI